MGKRVERLRSFFLHDLWTLDRSSFGKLRSGLIETLRIATVVIKDVLAGEITLRAMGLVYTTLLSLVPLLAVGFSVLKAFGVQNVLEPFLLDLLVPLGPTASELAQRIVGFVSNMRVGVLGFLGMALLIYTVIALLQKIEEAFNVIWRVSNPRGILQRFSDYLSVILVGPVLVVSALGLTTSLLSASLVQRLIAIGPVGAIVNVAGKIVPYLLVCAAFAFVYLFVPNTKVRPGPAAIGALAGGVLWQTVGWGFASFIVSSTRYGAVYSGFAVLVLFMIWLYLSWVILLVGAEIAFYRQNPHYLTLSRDSPACDTRSIERTALAVMYLVAQHFFLDRAPWTVPALTRRLGDLPDRMEAVVDALQSQRLLTATLDDPPALLPSRDISTIMLRDIYDAVRGPRVSAGPGPVAPVQTVERVLRAVEHAVDDSLKSMTLRDLLSADGDEAPAS